MRIRFLRLSLFTLLNTLFMQGGSLFAEIQLRPELQCSPEEASPLIAYIQHAENFANKVDVEKVREKCLKSPESFCWVDFRFLNCLNISYQLTGDTKYLDLFRQSFDVYRSVMSKGPDKYLGWYGKTLPNRQPKDQPDYKVDELQCNFRAISIMSEWVALARENENYAKANQDSIDQYLDLMTQHLFPKWDSRGHFSEVAGKGGVYRSLDYPSPVEMSLPFEKLSLVVKGCIDLYQVTEDPQYMKRALQVGTWFKRNLALIDGHYEWLNWAPAGKYDVSKNKPDAWGSWINPDPNGGWYVAGLSIALHLYQHGLLFNDTDLERFIKTQKEQCWNGDFEKPVFGSVDGTTAAQSKWVKGRFLSDQLAAYDSDLTKLAFHGPFESQREAQKHSDWNGCANAQDYVVFKYLVKAGVDHPRPYEKFGKAFLKDPANKTFYDALVFDVVAPGTGRPLPPSQFFKTEAVE